MEKPNRYLIKETGDIIEYYGRTLTDPHKGEYDAEYRIIKAVKFTLQSYVSDYQLYDHEKNEYYTLIKIPHNIDINNTKALEVLYG